MTLALALEGGDEKKLINYIFFLLYYNIIIWVGG
jgi:hypothetical protein